MYYVECYPDEKLVKAITQSGKKKIRHEKGKGNVLNSLSAKQSGIGQVDHDPEAIPSKKMAEYISVQRVGSITLFRHQRYTNCTLIQVSPRLEEWFISIAKSLQLELKDFKLPADGKKLHRLQRYEKFPGFNTLFMTTSREKSAALKLTTPAPTRRGLCSSVANLFQSFFTKRLFDSARSILTIIKSVNTSSN